MSITTPSNTSTTSQPTEAAHITATVFGESCPKCGSDEAWHGVVTEPGEDERFACDECGMWLAVQVTKPKPQPKPSKRRRFEFVVEFERGLLYVDINDFPLVAFERGKSLEIGRLAITTTRAIADGEDAEFYRGLDAGRKNAEREAEESAA